MDSAIFHRASPGSAVRPALAVQYVDPAGARFDEAGVLGVVGFGGDRPGVLPARCPFIAAPLAAADDRPMLEVWRAASPCRPVALGQVAGACNDEFIFGAISLDETGETLEAAVEGGYRAIFDFLDSTGFAAPLRFWNYLTAITKAEDGLERYRRFNIGRHRAFAARLRQALPPAASAVGGQGGASVVYVLAARQPARPVENPRQVSAYAYPQMHGPRSPDFSRASVYPGAGAMAFVSGTASITGHESRHAGDLGRQINETIANLEAIIAAAAPGALGDWTFKAYLHDPASRSAADAALVAAFGGGCRRVYLRGEMCRPELLVEIEAFLTTGSG